MDHHRVSAHAPTSRSPPRPSSSARIYRSRLPAPPGKPDPWQYYTPDSDSNQPYPKTPDPHHALFIAKAVSDPLHALHDHGSYRISRKIRHSSRRPGLYSLFDSFRSGNQDLEQGLEPATRPTPTSNVQESLLPPNGKPLEILYSEHYVRKGDDQEQVRLHVKKPIEEPDENIERGLERQKSWKDILTPPGMRPAPEAGKEKVPARGLGKKPTNEALEDTTGENQTQKPKGGGKNQPGYITWT